MNDVPTENLADLGHGQSHRTRLNDLIHQKAPRRMQNQFATGKTSAPPNAPQPKQNPAAAGNIFAAPAVQPQPGTSRAGKPTNHPLVQGAPGRGGGVVGGSRLSRKARARARAQAEAQAAEAHAQSVSNLPVM